MKYAFCMICAGLLTSWGCVPQPSPHSVGPTLDQIEAVRDDASLTLQERRLRLAEMGLSEVVINVVMIEQRLANQFGGDLRTALNKITSDRLHELTPDELQYYADAASGQGGAPLFDISDDEAQAIVDLLVMNDLHSADDVTDFLRDNPELPEDITRQLLEDLLVEVDPLTLVDDLPNVPEPDDDEDN